MAYDQIRTINHLLYLFDVFLTILCILTSIRFNYVYSNERNIYWQVGLYTFGVITP